MPDLAEVIKKYFGIETYKKKPEVDSVKQRVLKLNEHRKTNRFVSACEKRKIPENMSPAVTPKPIKYKQPEEVKPQRNSRLEMLLKYKAEKQKRIEEEKKNKKPLFKVTHVSASIGLPNLETVNLEIKGKSFKSKFAPPNHQFKPPANIKPISFNSNGSNTNNTKKNEHSMVTRSKGKVDSKVEEKKIVSSRNTKSKRAKNDPEKLVETLEKKTPMKIDSIILDDGVKTPNKKETPVYVSPFVTLSRGKEKARREFSARKSGKMLSFNTSPQAGAAYFEKRLNDEICRLQTLCNEWTKLKDDNDLPEEATSMIDVAIGQTNLLLTKKFAQFRDLINLCKNKEGERPVKCEDLHGFWDMINIQIENLNKRFDNLNTLRANHWEEILPEVKKEVKKKTKPVRTAKASAGLKAAIEAARRKKQELEEQKRRSCRFSEIKTESRNNSPGLMMMKVAQYAKSVETPGRSILRNNSRPQSAKSLNKIVLFKDDVENDANVPNLEDATPRRSRRLKTKPLDF